MKETQAKLLEWSKQFENFHLPRWEELPTIDFYMDQVCEYIQTYVDIFKDSKNTTIITPSMINNYVKLGLVPPPIKKKYSNIHIANILVITIIKQVTTISDIRDAMDMQMKTHSGRKSYNIFCDSLEQNIRHIYKTISNEKIELSFITEIDTLAVSTISISLSNKLIATKVVELKRLEME